MIQGFGCSGKDWGALPKMIASTGQRPVLTFDNRGINDSPQPVEGAKLDNFVEDTREVMESVGWSRAHVMGISMGGMIAQSLAKTHPDAVSSLTLGCTTPGGREAVPVPKAFLKLASTWAASDYSDPNEQRHLAKQFIRMMLPSSIAATGLRGSGGAVLEAKIVEGFLATQRSNEGLNGQLMAMGRFNSSKFLGDLGAPRIPGTLVVHGSEDAVIPPENGVILAEKIPGARHLEWKNAGHFFWLERPVELVACLSEFLKEHDQ